MRHTHALKQGDNPIRACVRVCVCAGGQLKVPGELGRPTLDGFLATVHWPADWTWDSNTTKSACLAAGNSEYVDTLRELVHAKAEEVAKLHVEECEQVLAVRYSEPAREEMRDHHPETLVSFVWGCDLVNGEVTWELTGR